MLIEGKTDFVDSGIMMSVPLNSADSYMKNPLTAGIKRDAEVLQPVGFFIRSLMFNRRVFSTEKKTFPHSNNKEVNKVKEDNKKRKKETENKK